MAKETQKAKIERLESELIKLKVENESCKEKIALLEKEFEENQLDLDRERNEKYSEIENCNYKLNQIKELNVRIQKLKN